MVLTVNDPLVICGCVMKIQRYQFDPLWGHIPKVKH